MRRRLLALVAGVIFVIGTVTVAGASVSSFTKKNGCDLITGDDITEIFGEAPVKTIPTGKKGLYTTCTWKIPTPDGAQFTAFIGLDKPNKLNKKDFKEKSKLPEAEKVPGIKKGFFLVEGNAATVTFIKNGNFVNVQYLGSAPEDVEANTDALIELSTGLYDEL